MSVVTSDSAAAARSAPASARTRATTAASRSGSRTGFPVPALLAATREEISMRRRSSATSSSSHRSMPARSAARPSLVSVGRMAPRILPHPGPFPQRKIRLRSKGRGERIRAVMQRDAARFPFDGQAKWFFLFAGPGAVAS